MKRFFIFLLLTLFVVGCETVEKNIPVTGLTLEPSELLMKVEERDTLEAVISPENATDSNLVWSVDPEGVVSVDIRGVVTALHEGEAKVKCETEDGGFSAECHITVNNVPSYPGKTVKITAGTFMMGSPEYEVGRQADETRHEVTLTKDYYMSECEITNAQYCDFLNAIGIKDEERHGYAVGTIEYFDLEKNETVTETQVFIYDCANISFGGGDEWGVTFNGTAWEPMPGYENHPAVFVTWFGAMAYAQYVGGDLPTAAQWEYAARAGNSTAYFWGDDASLSDQYVWYKDNSDKHTHPVGEKMPNAWGLYDMLGNVWEWCRDFYGPYPTEPVTDPVNTEYSAQYGKEYELRGSSWNESATITRCALRYGHQDWRYFCVAGFRVIFEIDE